MKTTTPTVASVVRLRGRNHQPLTVYNGEKHIKIAGLQHDVSWSIQVGAYRDETSAKARLKNLAAIPEAGVTLENSRVIPFLRGANPVFRARFTGLTAAQAKQACQSVGTAQNRCVVIAPGNG